MLYSQIEESFHEAVVSYCTLVLVGCGEIVLLFIRAIRKDDKKLNILKNTHKLKKVSMKLLYHIVH